MNKLLSMMRIGAIYSAPVLWPLSVTAHELMFEEPYAACESASRSESCAFTNSQGELHRGTCQDFADRLMCVRNQPIVFLSESDAAQQDQSHKHSNEESL